MTWAIDLTPLWLVSGAGGCCAVIAGSLGLRLWRRR
jgi:hypothetical protein